MPISSHHGAWKRLFIWNPPVFISWWNRLIVRVDTAATEPHTCTLNPDMCLEGAGATQLRATKIGTTCISLRGTDVGGHRSPLLNVRGGIEMCPEVPVELLCTCYTLSHVWFYQNTEAFVVLFLCCIGALFQKLLKGLNFDFWVFGELNSHIS